MHPTAHSHNRRDRALAAALNNVTDISVTSHGFPMVQVTARLPDALGAELDAAAQQLN